MQGIRSAAIVGLCALLQFGSTVSAQVVTLNSQDGSISITGKLLEFDGTNYLVESAIGPINIDATTVECVGDDCPQLLSSLNEFTIAGSGAMGADLIPTLIEDFATAKGGELSIDIGSEGQTVFVITNPDGTTFATITETTGSSDNAFAALANETATIGMSTRPASEQEIISFSNDGHGLLTDADQERILAIDGVIVVVNRDNPVRSLTLEQVAQVFAGEITNWSELGGGDAPITLIRRGADSGTNTVFNSAVMTPARLALSGAALIQDSNANVADMVAQDPNAIGVTSYAQERNARALSLEMVCGQISPPTHFSIQTEEYPLSRRLYLYLNAGPRPEVAEEFLTYLATDAAQNLVENTGFVGQRFTRRNLNEQGDRIAYAIIKAGGGSGALARLQRMIADLVGAERLSLTYRFIPGTSSLDNRALDDVQRMAHLIRSGAFDGREIMVLGFTDNIGVDSEIQRLSLVRAQQVAEAISLATGPEAMANVVLTPVGNGKLSPLACNETPAGREVNRRVELWLRAQ